MAVAPRNFGAVLEETYSIVESYLDFCNSFQSAYMYQSKDKNKRSRRKGAEAAISFPAPFSIDNSSVTGQCPQDNTPPSSNQGRRPVRGAALRARHGVVESYRLMSQTTKLRRPTDFDPNRGFQPLPTIPATPDIGSGYNDGLGALPPSRLILPIASSDEDIFRKPAPPPPDRPSRSSSRTTRAAQGLSNSTFDVRKDESDSDTEGPRRSKRARASKKKRKNTNLEIQGDDESVVPNGVVDLNMRPPSRKSSATENAQQETDSVAVEIVDSNSSISRTKTQKKNKDTPSNPKSQEVDDTCAEAMETDVPRSRTKTLRKNKSRLASTLSNVDDTGTLPAEPIDRTRIIQNVNPETTTSAPDVGGPAVEPMETETARTRTKTIRKNQPETATAAPDVDEPASLAIEPMETETARTRTKTIRKNQPETATAAPDVDEPAVEPMETESARTRTIRKNQPETTTAAPDVGGPSSLVIETMETESARTRTKTIRKKKQETDSTVTGLILEKMDVEPEDEDASRSQTTMNGSAAVAKAPFRAKRKTPKLLDNIGSTTTHSIATGTAAEVPAEKSRRSERSPSCPRNASITMPGNSTFKVPGPMDTLEMPGGAQCFMEQVDTVEDLLVVQNAPRTRSKMRAAAESRSRSSETVRTPGQDKENCSSAPISFIIGVMSAGKHATPLTLTNKILLSPKAKTTGSAARNKPARFIKEPAREVEKAKMAEARRKEEEALKKKQELMMLKKQEIRNQREMKIKKVTESRAAVEKEKLLQLEKEKKEREEKEKQAKAEMMRQKEEALLKKKLLNQQKAQEAEERRQKEEQMRLARLREQEEEQRKAAEARQRQVEEAERLAALRKQQQKEEEQARLQEKAKEKAKPAKAAKDETFDPDDYGIVDDDGDEQETKPRRPIPKWAEREARNRQLIVQSNLPPAIVRTFFNVEPRSPSLKEIFGRDAMIRPRTSSAVWATPPPPPSSS